MPRRACRDLPRIGRLGRVGNPIKSRVVNYSTVHKTSEGMSLYYEAATFISESSSLSDSLKSRVYNAKGRKSQPAQLFALLSETSKWSLILKEVVEHSQLLEDERKARNSFFVRQGRVTD